MLNIFESLCNQSVKDKVSEAMPVLPPQPDNQRNRAFALMSEIKDRFNDIEITEDAVWSFLLHSREHDFTGSRKQFTDLDWSVVAARFHSCRDNTTCFQQLVDAIKTQGSCRVYKETEQGSHKKVFEGIFDKSLWDRAEKYAHRTGFNVWILAYGTKKVFTPPIEVSRMADNAPPITEAEALEMSK